MWERDQNGSSKKTWVDKNKSVGGSVVGLTHRVVRWVFPQVFSPPPGSRSCTGTKKDTLFLVVGYVTLRFFDDDVKAVLVNK